MSDRQLRQPNILAGIGWMVVTSLLFVGVTGLVRHVGTDVPAPQGAFMRYVFGTILLAPAILSLVREPPHRTALRFYAARGLLHGAGVTLWFYAMARIPLAEVTAIGYTAPIYVAIGAALFLGERLHLRRISAIAVGVLGAFVILRPGFQELSVGQIASLASAPLFAGSFLFAKRLTDTEAPLAIVAMLSVVCTIVLLPGALIVWVTPGIWDTFWLAVTAVIATMGHYTMTRAFASAPLTFTQPLSVLQLVFASILGIVAFGEALDPFVIAGGAIVVAATTFISHREAVAARRQRTPPAVATKL